MPIMLKSGVRAVGLTPEILLALMVARDAFDKRGAAVVVTSLVDGKHSNGSLHYRGAAVDLRTHHLPGGNEGQTAQAIAADMRCALGADFDVVVERDHIHVEHQPHTGVNTR